MTMDLFYLLNPYKNHAKGLITKSNYKNMKQLMHKLFETSGRTQTGNSGAFIFANAKPW